VVYIAVSLIQVTELWAQVTQIAIGIWLLWRQLGATAVAPTLLALFCFLGQTQLAKRMGPSQAEWVKSVQRRIGVTSSILRSMKSVKLAGLVSSMGDLIQAERIREIKKALKFRSIMVLTNSVCTQSHPCHFSISDCQQQPSQRYSPRLLFLPPFRSNQRSKGLRHSQPRKLSLLLQF
jgi:hypothetical protein